MYYSLIRFIKMIRKEMMVFKNRGTLTQFQILAEIAEPKSNIHQKDIAKKLGISVQAVSENIKNLVDEGYVETSGGHGDYRITMKGIEKVKNDVSGLKTYVDEVLEIMNTYKSVWPAIAQENLKKGDEVGLRMDEGILYATTQKTSAYATVLNSVRKGEDVALTGLDGLIELEPGNVVIIKLPTMDQGGSRACDLNNIRRICEEKDYNRIGIMGTVSRAVVKKLGIKSDFEFATPQVTVEAAKMGLNVLVFTVGKMAGTITRRLDNEEIKYVVEDVRK